MRIGIATSGLWRLRDAVERLTSGTAYRLPVYGSAVDAIAGWGHKPTADRARVIARSKGIPYIAFEDGFLRSIHPGNGERPMSMVIDRTGIYYDSRQPSDLEALIRKRASSPLPVARVQSAMALLRASRLSKYNNATLQDVAPLRLKATRREDRVLVVDQTVGDASIVGARANVSTFSRMLDSAVRENQGAEVLVRIHPEAITGRKSAHFSPKRLQELALTSAPVAEALSRGLLRLTPEPINPWALLEACSALYCVSSQLGFEGVLAGCTVHSFGASFYNGWGLTQDRTPEPTSRRSRASLEAIFTATYIDYVNYFDPVDHTPSDFERTIEALVKKRSRDVS
ncbi:hypothetical protein [Roseibium aggregatum]|uniref:capsular polysaccharide export protein, LipB/KpsS family n=1 Tax=Roseibium aggregatum TaxID=187304 RepID=UPI001E3829D5|nr:hypothetical protein [Roseibium aggregatum]UES52109.1 hypothetical protein GFK88_22270 [Roseibium aggregatum]